jgi:anhydro-N-acetylmuramic acid kinase
MESQKKYEVIGIMSGTSLDGLDVCHVVFKKNKSRWVYTIKHTKSVKYTAKWHQTLANAVHLEAADLFALDVSYGKFIGEMVKEFMRINKIQKLDCIASHGHTVFHQPERGFTLQIGNGNAIAVGTNQLVVNDFRSMDVAKGGQGAPLVPVGDDLLFTDYDACLNIGGISNISFRKKNKREAFDICFTNMGLNYLANKIGKAFDRNGKIASSGKRNHQLAKKLQSFYKNLKAQPSLSWEIFDVKLKQLLDDENISLQDRMFTFVDVCAETIADVINLKIKKGSVLCTGGGSYNKFLVEKIEEKLYPRLKLYIPDNTLIEYKEALVFAFLAVLRLRKEVNCLKSVTGAISDSSCGILYEP